MKNKRGQFYIIAAVIILIIVAGIIGVKTYSSISAKPRSVESMSSELKEEGFRIVDHGIYSSPSCTTPPCSLKDLMDNFTSQYAPYFLHKTNNANVIFVYGNKSELYSVNYYNESTGSVSAYIGSKTTNTWTENTFINRSRIDAISATGTNKVRVEIFNNTYDFDLKDNEMFYFVIVQTKDGEVYVEKS